MLRLFIRSATAIDSQIGLILLGTATLLLLQTSINIASILGLMPMTGVPLPFISYGGSSYFILSFAFGICLKLERGRKPMKYFKRHEVNYALILPVFLLFY